MIAAKMHTIHVIAVAQCFALILLSITQLLPRLGADAIDECIFINIYMRYCCLKLRETNLMFVCVSLNFLIFERAGKFATWILEGGLSELFQEQHLVAWILVER